ncbi:MAG: hypothetical protein ACREUM_09245, partial [Nitrosospira sp.]
VSALSQHDRIQPIGGFRCKKYIPFYAANAILLVPIILCHYAAERTWRQINRMIRLKAAHQILKRQTSNSTSIIVLDQGPVYTLTTLFEDEKAKGQRFDAWWNSTLSEWATMLDMVIWLDAPEEVLLERIRTRDKWHLIKEKSDQEARDFLVRFRTLCKGVIDKLTESSGTKVVSYDTSRCPLPQIIKSTLIALSLDINSG